MSVQKLRKAALKEQEQEEEHIPRSYTEVYKFKDSSDTIAIKWNFSEKKESLFKDGPVQTRAEEVFELVKEYYKLKGKEVPKDEYNACIAEIRAPPPPEPSTLSKPLYGTPEFWKAYWIKKKAKSN